MNYLINSKTIKEVTISYIPPVLSSLLSSSELKYFFFICDKPISAVKYIYQALMLTEESEVLESVKYMICQDMLQLPVVTYLQWLQRNPSGQQHLQEVKTVTHHITGLRSKTSP